MSNNNIILLSRPVVGLLLLSTILIAVILLIDVANLAYAEHQQQPQNVTQLIQKLSTPVTSNASALGSSDAPVTLIEFGDYQCAACHKFHTDTEDLILTNLVKTGKVKFLTTGKLILLPEKLKSLHSRYDSVYVEG